MFFEPNDALEADYAAAGFGGSLGFGERPCVLVVDMCKAYITAGSPLNAGCEDAYESAARVVAMARQCGHPVVFTKVELQAGGTNGGLFYKKVKALACFEPGNAMGEFTHHLAPEPGEIVVSKQYASAFFGTSLASTLNFLRVDTVVVVGVSTSGCVRASTLDAMQHGFIPIVVRDACGDRAPEVHEANLFDLQAKYADVVDEGTALKLLKDGGSRALIG